MLFRDVHLVLGLVCSVLLCTVIFPSQYSLAGLCNGKMDDADTSQAPLKRAEQSDEVHCQILGSGACGTIYLCTDPHGRRWVEKRIRSNLRLDRVLMAQEAFEQECRFFSAATKPHPNILFPFSFDESRKIIYLPYCPQGDLLNWILNQLTCHKCVKEQDVIRIAKQVLSALLYCHSIGAVHFDIKPENVLIDGNGDARLTDFGLAEFCNGQTGKTYRGTSIYMVPEMRHGEQFSYAQADIYSFGMLLLVMLDGQPYDDRDSSQELGWLELTANQKVLETILKSNLQRHRPRGEREGHALQAHLLSFLLGSHPFRHRLSLSDIASHPAMWVGDTGIQMSERTSAQERRDILADVHAHRNLYWNYFREVARHLFRPLPLAPALALIFAYLRVAGDMPAVKAT